MHFIWSNGAASEKAIGSFVEAQDGDKKFNIELAAGFRIGEHAQLKHVAQSYAEWTSDKETPRTVTLRQFNSGVQTGDELEFRMPVEDGRIEEIRREQHDKAEQEANERELSQTD